MSSFESHVYLSLPFSFPRLKTTDTIGFSFIVLYACVHTATVNTSFCKLILNHLDFVFHLLKALYHS